MSRVASAVTAISEGRSLSSTRLCDSKVARAVTSRTDQQIHGCSRGRRSASSVWSATPTFPLRARPRRRKRLSVWSRRLFTTCGLRVTGTAPFATRKFMEATWTGICSDEARAHLRSAFSTGRADPGRLVHWVDRRRLSLENRCSRQRQHVSKCCRSGRGTEAAGRRVHASRSRQALLRSGRRARLQLGRRPLYHLARERAETAALRFRSRLSQHRVLQPAALVRRSAARARRHSQRALL